MEQIFLYIKNISDSLAQNYNLDLHIFLIVYLLSFAPFYLGYFLMIYGTTRKLQWKDLLNLNIARGKIRWNEQVTSGLFIHLFGRIMPYAYILYAGENLPIILSVIVWLVILISIVYFIYKFFLIKHHRTLENITILKRASITDKDELDTLWKIYDETFSPLNKISPCKQSLDYDHFVEALREPSVTKYLLSKEDFGLLGLALVTNEFKNTPWISEEYFRHKYHHQYNKRVIFYFMGIAIYKEFRGNKYSLSLLEYIIEDLPRDVVIGFDHSTNINPTLHFFTRVIKQSHLIKRTHIDRQNYHVVWYKK